MTSDLTHSSTPEPPSSEEAGQGSVFVTTHWSVVLNAGRHDTTRAQAALEQLCRSYWKPLYAYTRRVGHSPEDAEDLTQSFFAELLARQGVAQADPQRGRFRSFLLASLKNHLSHEAEKRRAWKRGGRARVVPLDRDTAETSCALQLADARDTPDRAFDRQWALTLLDVVLGRLRKEYADASRDGLFQGLKETLMGGRAEIAYRELAERLGMSEGAVKVAAHRLRRRYRELLRAEIAHTVSGPEEVEQELRHLFAALAGPS